MNQNIINKILKLIALRDGAKAIESHEEAHNAQLKVEALLKEHNLTENEVIQRSVKQEKDQPIDVTQKMYNMAEEIVKTEGDWRPKLMGVVARMNKCRIIIHGANKDAPLSIFGTEFNIEVTIATYQHLVKLIKSMANTAYRQYAKNPEATEKKNAFIRGFLRGVPNGMMQWWNEELKSKHNNETGLMVVSQIQKHQEAVEGVIAIKYPRLGQSKSTSLSSKAGRQIGHAAGYSMGRQGGVSSNKLGM